jgi:hypothetical protein
VSLKAHSGNTKRTAVDLAFSWCPGAGTPGAAAKRTTYMIRPGSRGDSAKQSRKPPFLPRTLFRRNGCLVGSNATTNLRISPRNQDAGLLHLRTM